MHIFESVRLRLTAWYLLIIVFICVSFSLIIYRDVSQELERGFRIAEGRLTNQLLPGVPRERALNYLESDLQRAKKALLLRLLLVNSIIVVVSGVGGYFLAGKTLQPIEVAMSEQKRFIADASHELRTPLTALKTEIEVGLRNRKFKLTDAKELLISNLQEVNKMRDFANYLLSESRYESKGGRIEKETVSLTEAVERGVENNLGIAKGKNIKVLTKLQDLEIRANAQSMVELVSILVNNAVKYSPKGSVVRVRLAKLGRKALIEVADKGVGIAKVDAPYIFDRFYRGDKSRGKKEIDGYGLGLSIAKSIVQSHGGKINVESKPQKGSTFRVVI